MEDPHRIHKEVPFGYWVIWIVPVWRFLAGRWSERTDLKLPCGTDQLSGPH